jgi:hypothetical protein
MRATCHAYLILLYLITLMKNTNYAAPHYAVFSSLLLFSLLDPNILLYPVLKHPQSVFFP